MSANTKPPASGSERYVNGRPMFWRGHRVERRQVAGTSNYSYRTLCGSEAPHAYLSCGDDPLTCMECALTLDAEKLP
jgi:hypothetical protein